MEKTDILVLVLAGKTKLSDRNLKAQKNTWMQSFSKKVKIITFSGSDLVKYDGNHLTVVADDDYSNLSFKTLKAFEWVAENIEFDYLMRTNTSSYIDLENLIKFCDSNNNELLYRGRKITNSFNKRTISYVSGAEILLSKKVFKLLIKNKKMWDINFVDDVSIGASLQNHNILIEESESIQFNNQFFKLKKFNHEYHFRCRVDSPFYYPRYLEKFLFKYIHKELRNNKISFFKRQAYNFFFQINRVFAFKKHYDFVTYYVFKYLKKLIKNI